MPGALAVRSSCVFWVTASLPSIGLATGVTDSLAFALAGFVADTGGGWKFAAQLLKSSTQKGTTKILMLLFMMMFFGPRRWRRFKAELLVPNVTSRVCDVTADAEICASKNHRRDSERNCRTSEFELCHDGYRR